MALPTYLQLVNEVLVRMREPTVSTVNENTVSALVGKFINDTKRYIADAYDWDAFNTSVNVTTTANNSGPYSIVGSGLRFKIHNVINTTAYGELTPITRNELDLYMYGAANTQKAAPGNYVLTGVDNNGDTQVSFWPVPDNGYVMRFSVMVPEADLSSDTDVTKLAKEPIILGALARALIERGEDGGITSSDTYALFKQCLGDIIALELARAPEFDAWEEV
jgi:hypothetical protein